MSEYVKTCTYCKNEIQMSDKEGRWLPYNKDGTTHDCKKKNGKQEITLEAVQKKLNYSLNPRQSHSLQYLSPSLSGK